MAPIQSILHSLCSLLLFLTAADALKFDVEAFSRGDLRGQRCIRNFVAKDTLVVVTATVDGTKGDGMVVNMHVSWISQPVGKTIANNLVCRLRMLLETNMDVQRTL